MYAKYPISGIKESYRHVQRTRTVVMPILIAIVLIGWLIFYFKGEPPAKFASLDRPEAIPSERNLTPMLPEAEAPGAPSFVLPPPEDMTGSTVSPAFPSNGLPLGLPHGLPHGLPLVRNDLVSEADFTPWMAPLALDTYIRQKNRGYTESFWDRGHWIVAIEGRWHSDRHEFRIVYEAIPDRERFDWYYRIDQTEMEYRDTLSRLGREGYTLVQSQAYELPDKTKRYQAVWHREIPENPSATGLLGSAGA